MKARAFIPLTVTLLASLMLGLAPVFAQSSLTSLEIELWPEFDQPSVLVLINGELPADTPLPATITLRIPAPPFAVAERAPDGSLLNATFVTQTVGSEVDVTLTLQQPAFRLEYYDAALTRSGEARQYAFGWAATVAANNATIRVQTPAQATGMQLSPNFGPATVGEYGLNYYTAQLGAVAAGQTLSAQISYSKTGAALTVEQINTQPEIAPVNVLDPATTQVDYTPWVIGAIVLAGVAIISGVFVWYRSNAGAVRAQPRPHHRSRKITPKMPRAHSPNGATAAQRFCTQCGQSLTPVDRFCRQCGEPVKVN